MQTAQILRIQLVRAQQFLRPQGGRDELDSHFKAVGCVEHAAVFFFERRLQVLPSDVGVLRPATQVPGDIPPNSFEFDRNGVISRSGSTAANTGNDVRVVDFGTNDTSGAIPGKTSPPQENSGGAFT